MRRVLFLLLKVAVSALLLYLSLRAVHLESVGARLASAKASWLAAAAALGIAQLVLLAVRWREIADAGTARLTVKAALQFTFIGSFFSQVLPSTVGGDAARIFLLARSGGGWAHATYSVLIDRIVGVTLVASASSVGRVGRCRALRRRRAKTPLHSRAARRRFPDARRVRRGREAALKPPLSAAGTRRAASINEPFTPCPDRHLE